MLPICVTNNIIAQFPSTNHRSVNALSDADLPEEVFTERTTSAICTSPIMKSFAMPVFHCCESGSNTRVPRPPTFTRMQIRRKIAESPTNCKKVSNRNCRSRKKRFSPIARARKAASHEKKPQIKRSAQKKQIKAVCRQKQTNTNAYFQSLKCSANGLIAKTTDRQIAKYA